MDCWDVNDNLTRELHKLRKLHENVKQISLKLIMPRIITYSVNDFREYQNKLNEFIQGIDFPEDKENCSELFKLILSVDQNQSIIDPIINNLHKLTQYKNRIWCETRVKNALQRIIPLLRTFTEYIDFDTETTLNTESLREIINDTFIESIINFDTINNLHNVTYFVCMKCKQKTTFLSEDKQVLLCSDCSDNYQEIRVVECDKFLHAEPEPELVT